MLTQLSCFYPERYLLRRGLPIRGHNADQQGNLQQLLVMMAGECSLCVRDWIKENTCPKRANNYDGVVRVANTFEQHKDGS